MDSNTNHPPITLVEFLETVTHYLDDLTGANRKLLDTLKEYQELIVNNENNAIELATPRLDRAAGEIRIIDERRRAYVDDFFILMGWNGPRNFSSLEERITNLGVTDEEAMAFNRAAQARMTLIGILAEVDAQNSLNLTLIGQGLSFAEVSLRALLGYSDNSATYGPDDKGGDGPTLLDAQA